MIGFLIGAFVCKYSLHICVNICVNVLLKFIVYTYACLFVSVAVGTACMYLYTNHVNLYYNARWIVQDNIEKSCFMIVVSVTMHVNTSLFRYFVR